MLEYTTEILVGSLLVVNFIAFFISFWAGGVCKVKKDLTGKIVIVTGSNTGIGKETSRVLASMGATVILACRDEKKTVLVVDELKKSTKSEKIYFIKLDLSSLESVKQFVNDFKKKFDKLDILVNNAGIMALPDRTLTKDGYEMQFGTNHLGHFYLTTLLLDCLKKSEEARVVNLSSLASATGKIYWEDVNLEKGYNMAIAYSQSKLCNILFTKELQRRFEKDNILSYSVHPGVVRTELTRYMNTRWYIKLVMTTIAPPVFYLCGKSPLQGAQTTLFCTLEDKEKLVKGGHYADCKLKRENSLAKNEENGKKLWELSEKLVAAKVGK